MYKIYVYSMSHICHHIYIHIYVTCKIKFCNTVQRAQSQISHTRMAKNLAIVSFLKLSALVCNLGCLSNLNLILKM